MAYSLYSFSPPEKEAGGRGFKDLSHILDIFFVVFIARVLAYYREPNNSVDSTFN